MSLYVKLQTSYYKDPKIIAAGEKAELLYVRACCMCKELLNDGQIERSQLTFLGLTKLDYRIQALIDAGLWQPVGKDTWEIVAWLKHNPSSEWINQRNEQRRKAGKRSAMVRSDRAQKKAAAPKEETPQEPFESIPDSSSTDPLDRPRNELPPENDWDIDARVQHWRSVRHHHTIPQSEMMVRQYLHILHTDKSIVNELGRRLTAEEIDRIVTNWCQHQTPARVADLMKTTRYGTPWWIVCLQGKGSRKPSNTNDRVSKLMGEDNAAQ